LSPHPLVDNLDTTKLTQNALLIRLDGVATTRKKYALCNASLAICLIPTLNQRLNAAYSRVLGTGNFAAHRPVRGIRAVGAKETEAARVTIGRLGL
jgi:hypothetical protein